MDRGNRIVKYKGEFITGIVFLVDIGADDASISGREDDDDDDDGNDGSCSTVDCSCEGSVNSIDIALLKLDVTVRRRCRLPVVTVPVLVEKSLVFVVAVMIVRRTIIIYFFQPFFFLFCLEKGEE
jgi:hypothetical protein